MHNIDNIQQKKDDKIVILFKNISSNNITGCLCGGCDHHDGDRCCDHHGCYC